MTFLLLLVHFHGLLILLNLSKLFLLRLDNGYKVLDLTIVHLFLAHSQLKQFGADGNQAVYVETDGILSVLIGILKLIDNAGKDPQAQQIAVLVVGI